MRKYVFTALAVVGALSLVSWGFKAHRTIASIAQKHLKSNTAYVVSAYLNGQSMSDVSTWADENRNPKTASWHYLNLPLGLSHEAFVKAVLQSEGNVTARL